MKQCLIYDSSLKYSRATYGLLILVAFLLRNHWLILIASILIILGAISIKLNLFYQFYTLIAGKKLKPIEKESGELSFVAGATGALLLIGFFLIYFHKFVEFAWIYLLVVDLMIFLACFVGFCIATLMYVFFKKLITKNSIR